MYINRICISKNKKKTNFLASRSLNLLQKEKPMVVLHVPVQCWCTRLKMNQTLISSLQFLEAIIIEKDKITFCDL